MYLWLLRNLVSWFTFSEVLLLDCSVNLFFMLHIYVKCCLDLFPRPVFSQFWSSGTNALHVFDVSLLHHTWFKWMAPYQATAELDFCYLANLVFQGPWLFFFLAFMMFIAYFIHDYNRWNKIFRHTLMDSPACPRKQMLASSFAS